MGNIIHLKRWRTARVALDPQISIGPMSCCTITTLIDGSRMFIPSREPPVVIHDQYVGLLTALYDVFGADRPIAAKLVKAAARKSQLLWFALDGGVDDSTYVSKKITRTRRSRDRRRRAQTRQDAFGFTSQRDGLGFLKRRMIGRT
jgi:hypothetical protein